MQTETEGNDMRPKTFNTSLLRLLFLGLSVVLLSTGRAADNLEGCCPMVKIVPERLADLNIPRFSHSVFYANGELTVVGGHTSGFVLTPTAEYFKDGEWHLMKTVYNHDDGICVPLRSGKVLLAGGYERNLGIGQTFEVEMYDPATHTFDGFGCLDKKRAHSVGIEMDNGQVVITGNWYHPDAIATYDSGMYFKTVKEVSVPRSAPFLFKISDGDVMVVSGWCDNYGKDIEDKVVDRLKGSSFHVPLLDSMQSLQYHRPPFTDDFFIGDVKKGDYAYLFPVRDKSGQMSIALVRDTVFSLLPTDCPIPMEDSMGVIDWYTTIAVDRHVQRGYMMGHHSVGHQRKYLLSIDYGKTPAQLLCYYTDSIRGFGGSVPVLTPQGNIVLVGGTDSSNFSPLATVWLFPVGDDGAGEYASFVPSSFIHRYLLPLAVFVVLLMMAGGWLFWKHRRQPSMSASQPPSVDEQVSMADAPANNQLMQRMEWLMEHDQLYLRPGLKLSDIAVALNTNSRYVSDVIKVSKGCSFSQFVNGYRIAHAQQLMTADPDIKLHAIASESGFANDKALVRAFRDFTSMTPTEWKVTIKQTHR